MFTDTDIDVGGIEVANILLFSDSSSLCLSISRFPDQSVCSYHLDLGFLSMVEDCIVVFHKVVQPSSIIDVQ